jgi:hypothetical protein
MSTVNNHIWPHVMSFRRIERESEFDAEVDRAGASPGATSRETAP